MAALESLLAIDLGAESGRAVKGTFDGKCLQMEEIHRFPNQPVKIGSTMYWDILSIYANIEAAITKAQAMGPVRSVGIDTWGVDFGLLDAKGQLLGNPVHYRDPRTSGMIERACEIVPREEIFNATGNMFLELNTLYQLFALSQNNDPALAIAERMLNVPDLLHYWLSGEKANELTIASTTQCMATNRREWAWDLLRKLGISERIFGSIAAPGTKIGNLRSNSETAVVVPCTHDTGSAVMAVPGSAEDSGWVSCGTWSVTGVSTKQTVVNPGALQNNFTNESSALGLNRFSCNIMGLWLIQESRRQWLREGKEYTYPELVEMAKQSAPLRSIINPDAECFFRPEKMVDAIQNFCQSTSQPVPQSPGEVARCVFESLALAYRKVFDAIRDIANWPIKRIHIIGGGCQNTLLCQFTADAMQLPVIAGPIEATAIGNLLVQVTAHGWVNSLAEMTEVVRQSFPTIEYQPASSEGWEEAYAKFLQYIK